MNFLFLSALAVPSERVLTSAIVGLVVLLVLLLAGAVILELMLRRTHSRSRQQLLRTLSLPVYITAIVVFCFALYCGNRLSNLPPEQMQQPTGNTQPSTNPETSAPPETYPPETTLPPTEPTQPPTLPTEPTFPSNPGSSENSDPDKWSVDWDIIVNGSVVESYQRPQSITFGSPDAYFSLPGVCGFRGNNHRNGATYGTANVTQETLSAIWEREISALPKAGEGYWTGAGWTGQPLVVQWDEETKAIMNLYPEKKAKKDLVEVIYATLDGHIYFYDLETGEYTRKPLNVGMTFKGSGALDPRGYPIMYVGSGDRTHEGKYPRMYIINLIDCSIMYEYGHEKDFNYRSWRGFDASPLVDAETDTLIWPGENGLLYTIKLNTDYDKSGGTLSISPDKPVMTRYSTSLDRTVGYEASPILVDSYLYIGDNGGMFFCIDINTMEVLWAQFIRDDLNATPVFAWGEDGQGYLYLATSMEFAQGESYIYKLNASNGEVVWKKDFTDVAYDKAVSGGALSSPLLGKKGTDMDGLILFHIARTPNYSSGTLIALDTETGDVVWEKVMSNYAWSSPVAIHTEDGRAYVVLCDSVGRVHLMKGSTGEVLDTISLGSNIEASPVVYKDTLVVGTRGQWVYGVKIQ